MNKTRLSHVTEYNAFMLGKGHYIMVMTTGNGSVLDKPRERGWVVWQSPSMGDDHDFAKWLPNKQQALKELRKST